MKKLHILPLHIFMFVLLKIFCFMIFPYKVYIWLKVTCLEANNYRRWYGEEI
jgi:hypothetical protein